MDAQDMPKLVLLARVLARVTHPHWPMESEYHFTDRAFVEDPYCAKHAEGAYFKLIGCGNFTAVFTHPLAPGYAFKLNAGTRDRMEELHRWLMTQDHPHLPRVYHVEHYGGGCVAVAERLERGGNRYEVPHETYLLLEEAGFPVDDAHPGNVMLRGSVSVLNDPTSNRHAPALD